jgi:hypothetical protein
MKRTRMYLPAVILISAILLAACGQAAAPETTGPKATEGTTSLPVVVADNCALLSKEEVGTILAQAVSEVREQADGTLCVYQTEKLIFELGFLNTGAISGAQYLENVRGMIGDSAVTAELGDESFYNTTSAYHLLMVRKGDSVYTFGVRKDPTSQEEPTYEEIHAQEKALAELLLGRLP